MSGASLTILTFLPFAGGLILLFLRKGDLARWVALGFSLAALVLALGIWLQFEGGRGDLQFTAKASWIPTLGVDYFVGVDGLGVLLVLLSALVAPVGILVSWNIREKAPLYFSLMLFLQTGLFGAFTALNFFHWFIFWELSLVPAFFLVRLWGGAGRSAAAVQFFVYTMVGSIAMLLGFLAIFLATGTFDFMVLAEMGRTGALSASVNEAVGWGKGGGMAMVVFLGLLLGFAVKVPLFPFHTWLPATYAEAPPGTTIVLTGALSKMGVYGFLRILAPLFPDQMRLVLGPLLVLAVLTILFSALAALAQKDFKRMLAYSSITHLGYCLLGIFAALRWTEGDAYWALEKSAALNGVLLQMFNHGVIAAALFAMAGFLEQRSGGLRGLNDFGGLRKVAPVFCGLMGIAVFASLGLPGLNGFVGEFLIFKGTFSLASWAAVLGALGLLVTAVFLLIFFQKVFNGPLNERWAGLRDLSWSERCIVGPAIFLIFVLGIQPQWVMGKINVTVTQMVAQFLP